MAVANRVIVVKSCFAKFLGFIYCLSHLDLILVGFEINKMRIDSCVVDVLVTQCSLDFEDVQCLGVKHCRKEVAECVEGYLFQSWVPQLEG